MSTVNLPQPVIAKPPSQDIAALREVFAAIQAESCPRSFNFHMHTVFSDGQLQPEQLAQQAIAIGLQGFAITDHHSVSGYRLAQSWLDEQRQNAEGQLLPHLWVGVEITSSLLDTEVHILGFGFDPDHGAMQPYLQGKEPQGLNALAESVIAAIQMAGGLAVLAHPARYRRSPEELIPAAAQAKIDGTETYYAYDNPSLWRPSPMQTEQVLRLNSVYGLLSTCGTDTHGKNLLQRL
jgi:hypothetical protein